MTDLEVDSYLQRHILVLKGSAKYLPTCRNVSGPWQICHWEADGGTDCLAFLWGHRAQQYLRGSREQGLIGSFDHRRPWRVWRGSLCCWRVHYHRLWLQGEQAGLKTQFPPWREARCPFYLRTTQGSGTNQDLLILQATPGYSAGTAQTACLYRFLRY